MTTETPTEQQARLRDAAQALLDAINDVIPDTTIDWRIEDARRIARTLAAKAGDVVTRDEKERRQRLEHVACDLQVSIHTLYDCVTYHGDVRWWRV